MAPMDAAIKKILEIVTELQEQVADILARSREASASEPLRFEVSRAEESHRRALGRTGQTQG